MPKRNSEALLRDRVLTLLKEQRAACGGRLAWFSISDVWITGLPDIVGVIDGRFFALELKAEDGVVANRQKEWLRLFSFCGARAGVIRATSEGKYRARITWVGDDQAYDLTDKFLFSETFGKGVFTS
jgi:hypothetical protein